MTTIGKKQAISGSFWLEEKLIQGDIGKPSQGGICVIGSGLSGVSTAYWLQEKGFQDLTILDFETEKAASFRNCGHILHGTVESMQALQALHGLEVAHDIWSFSVSICDDVKHTIQRENLDVDYRQDGYLVIAIDEPEMKEIRSSVEILQQLGFQSRILEQDEVEKLGFRQVFGGRYEPGSAQAHPCKFRNQLLERVLERGGNYFSQCKVFSVTEGQGQVTIECEGYGQLKYDACVIASNAYSPLLSDFFKSRQLVVPYRGQILTSNPLQHDFPVTYPHSFDHGYEYALITPDNRLMLGGWRNHTEGGEEGTYDISTNPFVEQGLKDFAKTHYKLDEDIQWAYSWAGIMASSRTGFPFIGPTASPLIFTVAGFTGHGFSWAHGSAKLLASIMAGEPVPEVAKYFNPCSPM